MSFRCAQCNEPQIAGTRPHRVITKIRDRWYSGHVGDYRGWEIVQEEDICDPCFATVEVVTPAAELATAPPKPRPRLGDGIHEALRYAG